MPLSKLHREHFDLTFHEKWQTFFAAVADEYKHVQYGRSVEMPSKYAEITERYVSNVVESFIDAYIETVDEFGLIPEPQDFLALATEIKQFALERGLAYSHYIKAANVRMNGVLQQQSIDLMDRKIEDIVGRAVPRLKYFIDKKHLNHRMSIQPEKRLLSELVDVYIKELYRCSDGIAFKEISTQRIKDALDLSDDDLGSVIGVLQSRGLAKFTFAASFLTPDGILKVEDAQNVSEERAVSSGSSVTNNYHNSNVIHTGTNKGKIVAEDSGITSEKSESHLWTKGGVVVGIIAVLVAILAIVFAVALPESRASICSSTGLLCSKQ